MIGWWEDDPVVRIQLPPPPPPSPPMSCSKANYTNMTQGYWESCGGFSGNIFFGKTAPPAPPAQYPELTIAEAKSICCALNTANGTCKAFDVPSDTQPGIKVSGVFKKNIQCGIKHDAGYNGYRLDGGAGPSPGSMCSANVTSAGATTSVLATSYVEYGVRALIVVASWCSGATKVGLEMDWDALGFSEDQAVFSLPAIASVQSAAAYAPPVSIDANQGFIVLVQRKSR